MKKKFDEIIESQKDFEAYTYPQGIEAIIDVFQSLKGFQRL